MTYDKKLQMDPEQLKVLARRVEDASAATAAITEYLKESPFSKKDLGSMRLSHDVAGSLTKLVEDLQKSLNKVTDAHDGYLKKVSAAIDGTAKAERLTDEDNKWHFEKLQQGM